MWQMNQLPEWMDMGDEEDFATPTISLAEQLKKKMGKSKPLGGIGAAGGMMDMPSAASSMGAAKGGPQSL